MPPSTGGATGMWDRTPTTPGRSATWTMGRAAAVANGSLVVIHSSRGPATPGWVRRAADQASAVSVIDAHHHLWTRASVSSWLTENDGPLFSDFGSADLEPLLRD